MVLLHSVVHAASDAALGSGRMHRPTGVHHALQENFRLRHHRLPAHCAPMENTTTMVGPLRAARIPSFTCFIPHASCAQHRSGRRAGLGRQHARGELNSLTRIFSVAGTRHRHWSQLSARRQSRHRRQLHRRHSSRRRPPEPRQSSRGCPLAWTRLCQAAVSPGARRQPRHCRQLHRRQSPRLPRHHRTQPPPDVRGAMPESIRTPGPDEPRARTACRANTVCTAWRARNVPMAITRQCRIRNAQNVLWASSTQLPPTPVLSAKLAPSLKSERRPAAITAHPGNFRTSMGMTCAISAKQALGRLVYPVRRSARLFQRRSRHHPRSLAQLQSRRQSPRRGPRLLTVRLEGI